MWRLVIAAVVVVALVFSAVPATAGAPAGLVRTVFTVEGMHCDGCTAAIVGALQRIDGVVEASADHEKGQAVAVYRPRKASADELKQAIEKLGYTVTAMETTPVEE